MTDVFVEVGATVEAKQELLKVESGKTSHTIEAEATGEVMEITSVGTNVEPQQVLAVIQKNWSHKVEPK